MEDGGGRMEGERRHGVDGGKDMGEACFAGENEGGKGQVDGGEGVKVWGESVGGGMGRDASRVNCGEKRTEGGGGTNFGGRKRSLSWAAKIGGEVGVGWGVGVGGSRMDVTLDRWVERGLPGEMWGRPGREGEARGAVTRETERKKGRRGRGGGKVWKRGTGVMVETERGWGRCGDGGGEDVRRKFHGETRMEGGVRMRMEGRLVIGGRMRGGERRWGVRLGVGWRSGGGGG